MPNLTNRTLEDQVKKPFRYRCKLANRRCAYCRQLIDYSAPANHAESFEVAHKHPVKTHPHLAYDPQNFLPSHSKCNRSEGAKAFEERPWKQANWG